MLVALDYDGTLAPIAGTPEAARLPPQTADVLSELAASDRFSVAVVSGRSLADLKGRLGLDVIYVGNHGLEIEGPGISFVHPEAEALRGAIDQACWDLEAAFEGVPGRGGGAQGLERDGPLPAGACRFEQLDRGDGERRHSAVPVEDLRGPGSPGLGNPAEAALEQRIGGAVSARTNWTRSARRWYAPATMLPTRICSTSGLGRSRSRSARRRTRGRVTTSRAWRNCWTS